MMQRKICVKTLLLSVWRKRLRVFKFGLCGWIVGVTIALSLPNPEAEIERETETTSEQVATLTQSEKPCKNEGENDIENDGPNRFLITFCCGFGCGAIGFIRLLILEIKNQRRTI